MHVIKDNSISLLEFVFDLNFDKIIFPENPIKIVQNKDTYLTPYKIGQPSVSFQSKLTSRTPFLFKANSLSSLFLLVFRIKIHIFPFFFHQDLFYFLFF